ncbi:MAG: SGNH/GDSL hydrolase family protein [Verrucomicrobiales bacterium]|nr:SGNH/GDSL hydrolase family protein [Verrucomicrobiales bacterium]
MKKRVVRPGNRDRSLHSVASGVTRYGWFFTKNWVLALCLAAGFATNLILTKVNAAPPARESIEWCDIWISHANETNLPRVLLIGDSIVRDYYPEVEKGLAGKAFVARLSTSRFVADPVLHKEIELVLVGTKFDVIVFNNGMHGWQHSEVKYREAFPKLIKTIRTRAPKARLIWATTTPLRDGKGVTGDTKAEYSDERIAARNALAAEVVTVRRIPTVDLNATVRGHPEFHSDNVHFNGEGSQILAALVSAAVEKLLPP